MPNVYTHFFSITAFIVSFLIFSRYSVSKLNKSVFSLIAFSYIFLCAAYKVADYFTGNGIDLATVIQVKFGLRGAAFGAYVGLISLTLGILLASIVMFAVFIVKGSRKKDRDSSNKYFLAYSLLIIALLANPATINLYNLPTGTFIPSRASSESAVAEFYKYYKKAH